MTRLLFAFHDVPFRAKALKMCDYSCVITIYTLPITLYLAWFRTPTSTWASQPIVRKSHLEKRRHVVIRYAPQGAMSQASNGGYVAASDYDKLAGALQHVLSTASTYFKHIKAGDLAANDREALIKSST